MLTNCRLFTSLCLCFWLSLLLSVSLAISNQAFWLERDGLGVPFKIFTARLGLSVRISQKHFQKITFITLSVSLRLSLSVCLSFSLFLSLFVSLFLYLPEKNIIEQNVLVGGDGQEHDLEVAHRLLRVHHEPEPVPFTGLRCRIHS